VKNDIIAEENNKIIGGSTMTYAAILIFIVGAAGAVFTGVKRKWLLFAICIIAALLGLFYLLSLALLIGGID